MIDKMDFNDVLKSVLEKHKDFLIAKSIVSDEQLCNYFSELVESDDDKKLKSSFDRALTFFKNENNIENPKKNDVILAALEFYIAAREDLKGED